jgi:hypothetical protein
VASILVRANSKVVFEDGKAGRDSVITQMDENFWEDVLSSRNFFPKKGTFPWSYPPSMFKWVHLLANKVGTFEVRFWARDGRPHTIKFSSVLATEADLKRIDPSWSASPKHAVVKLNLDSEGEKKVSLDGYDSLEVTVAGNVADGWATSPASETGFELVSVERAETTYISKPASKPSEQEGNAEQIPGVTSSIGKPELIKAPPQVKLYFSSTRNPKNSTMVIRQGSGSSGKTFEFKIEARPTPRY